MQLWACIELYKYVESPKVFLLLKNHIVVCVTIWSDYFSLSTVYILTKDNMIDIPKNSVSRILELIPNSSIRIAVFHKDIAADIEIPKEIKTSSTPLL